MTTTMALVNEHIIRSLRFGLIVSVSYTHYVSPLLLGLALYFTQDLLKTTFGLTLGVSILFASPRGIQRPVVLYLGGRRL